MKKLSIFIVFICFIPIVSFAQEANPRINEVGLSIRGATSFGIRYKTGSEKTLLRITLLSANGSTYESKNNSVPDADGENKSCAFGLNIGFEKRKTISDNFVFYYGSDLINSYNRSSYETPGVNSSSVDWGLSTGIGIVMGICYKINSSINISAEVMPSVWYTYGKSINGSAIEKSTRTNSGLDYGLVSPGANISFSFRFGKKS